MVSTENIRQITNYIKPPKKWMCLKMAEQRAKKWALSEG